MCFDLHFTAPLWSPRSPVAHCISPAVNCHFLVGLPSLAAPREPPKNLLSRWGHMQPTHRPSHHPTSVEARPRPSSSRLPEPQRPSCHQQSSGVLPLRSSPTPASRTSQKRPGPSYEFLSFACCACVSYLTTPPFPVPALLLLLLLTTLRPAPPNDICRHPPSASRRRQHIP